jgi:hypothetical protein
LRTHHSAPSCAEFVEKPGDVAFLLKVGADYRQGLDRPDFARRWRTGERIKLAVKG